MESMRGGGTTRTFVRYKMVDGQLVLEHGDKEQYPHKGPRSDGRPLDRPLRIAKYSLS